MRLRPGLVVMTSAVFLTLLVIVLASPTSSKEVVESNEQFLEEKSSLEPHKRSKRTIGHIFDMFKKMMDGLFGGKGGGKGKGKGRGRGRRPQRPGSPPSGGYGAPSRPSYGAPQRPNLSGGYAGGQAPPQRPPPPQRPVNNYGGPQSAPSNNYGGPQSAPSNNYGGPQQQNSLDSYGSPQAAPIGNQDSYGSPQAAPVGPPSSYNGGGNQAPPRRPQSTEFGPSSVFYMIPAPNLATEAPQGGFNSAPDSYGSPQAAPAGNQDSYGAPQAAPIGGNQDSYGAPQAAPIGNQDSYGSPQAAPVGNQDSYGSPQAAPVGNTDSYGSPQAAPVAPAGDSYGSPQAAPNNYNSPQTNSNPFQSNFNSVSENYASPQQQNSVAPSNSYSNNNPFISTNSQASYGNNAAPLPVTNNDLSGNFVPFTPSEDSYGSPAPVAPVSPVTDIDLPDSNPIVIAGRAPDNNLDLYGSVAPVGTSAPVPDEFLDQRDEYSPSTDIVDVSIEDYDETGPQGEVTSTKLAEEGEASPLFEDLRNVAFTSADSVTEAIDREPIEIDLSEGVVDLTNGLDQNTGPGEFDLTSYNQEQVDTTPVPSFEYEDEEYEYIGDEDVPPELPADLDIRTPDLPDNQDQSLAQGVQESYGKQEESALKNSESEYEYYYDDEGEYYYDDEQLPDEYGQNTYSQGPTTASTTVPIEDEEVGNFISVPLMIEEVAEDTAPVILAGTSSDTQQQPTYGNRNTKRRAPHAFHQFLVEAPQAKRQADWSQRISTRRNRVWRQFNLD